MWGVDPPPRLLELTALREAQNQEARNEYTYRQTVLIEELDERGVRAGDYREVREVIFTPKDERIERLVGKPVSNLKRLQLTEEDFHDIREIQPFLLTQEQARLYEVRFRGEETLEGIPCFVLEVRPRQILTGQRLFEGMFWIGQKDYSILRSAGQAVPQIRRSKSENLFPHFTTVREKFEGRFWFPVKTVADDTLYFRTGAQRIRLTIRYSDYKRFTAESRLIP